MSRTDDVRVVNPHDTALVSGYRNPRLAGIGGIWPIIETNKEAGVFTEYGPDASVIRQGLETPMGTPRKLIDVSLAKDEYRTVKVGVKVPYYDEERGEAADPQTLEEKKSRLGMDVIQLGMEYTVATFLQNPANYDASYVEALSGTARWNDYTNSDPLGDIARWLGTTELKMDLEQDELTVWLAADVWNTVKQHPKLLSRPSTNQDKVVNLANLANWIGCREIIILRGKHAVTFDKKDPRNAVFAHLWSKVAIVGRRIDSPSADEPLAGYIARRKGFPQVEDDRDKDLDADIKHVKDKWGANQRANNRLFLGRTVID